MNGLVNLCLIETYHEDDVCPPYVWLYRRPTVQFLVCSRNQQMAESSRECMVVFYTQDCSSATCNSQTCWWHWELGLKHLSRDVQQMLIAYADNWWRNKWCIMLTCGDATVVAARARCAPYICCRTTTSDNRHLLSKQRDDFSFGDQRKHSADVYRRPGRHTRLAHGRTMMAACE